MYHVTWTGHALRSMEALDAGARQMIVSWVSKNLDGCDRPQSVGDCKRLKGTKDGWRWRLGRHRILASVRGDELVIEIVNAGLRKDAYKTLSSLF